jgi:hypothetical protein
MKYQRSESGVALVITLIMLAVITIIAVAFLALSQRERASISQTMTGTETEQMMQAGLERAMGHIKAQISTYVATNLVFTNAQNEWFSRPPMGPDLTVSITTPITNAPPPQMQTVDYEVLTNLLYDPQPPVYTTNGGAWQLQNYLDLNRNAKFEPSGLIPVLDNRGIPTGPLHDAIGDPQWVGVLPRINEPHSSSNRFGGRYAYLVIPVGRTLDIDFIHNEGKGIGARSFFRSQGFASWELNLAAFLADLNTNLTAQYGWGDYRYNANLTFPSGGAPFDDASQILNYRHLGRTLKTARDLFGGLADSFASDGIDQYANGSANNGGDNDAPTAPWVGGPNPLHFFSVHEFFNARTNSMQQFQNRLRNAGVVANDSYNRETFYRMLAQLGTDSVPEKPRYVVSAPGDARINLNYANTNDVDALDFVPWTAEGFFHTTADRLLRDHRIALDANTALSVTNLPVYPTNYYSSAVHRILQMTLNIFDAMTNRHGTPRLPHYPTVLRPVFENNGQVVRIVGYEEIVPGRAGLELIKTPNWKDLSNATDRAALQPDWGVQTNYVYGVPVLVGAKKGYPNFNEYFYQQVAQFERKLMIAKPASSRATTNQMFIIGVSNIAGLEAWNSYSTPYPRDLTLVAGVEISMSLTNEYGDGPLPQTFATNSVIIIPANTWAGQQFRTPLTLPITGPTWVYTNYLPNSIYQAQKSPAFYPQSPVRWETNYFPAPQWVLTATNRVRFFLFDGRNITNNAILVDAVGLAPQVVSMNITKEMQQFGANQAGLAGNVWDTNRVQNARYNQLNVITRGIENQIRTALAGNRNTWDNYGRYENVRDGVTGFQSFINTVLGSTNISTNMMVPFTPQYKVHQKVAWQVNDPLVHYMSQDIVDSASGTAQPSRVGNSANPPNLGPNNIGTINPNYRPWNYDNQHADNINKELKDPLVRSSDDWNFPTTNKFGNIGLLGRVHRGTPWQTVYLKANAPAFSAWTNHHAGGFLSMPTNDWRLADIFTVAQHPNASRGRLSINQTNVAAWSAVLSGAEVRRLAVQGGAARAQATIIEPAFVAPELTNIVQAINTWRDSMYGQSFSSLAEFLQIPELTVRSPYLTDPFVSPNALQFRDLVLTDADYEAIPEKILSLVKVGEPRFVIYAFGQSLKPAPQSVLPSGNFRGLCVNYEVTGELAARAVVRVEMVTQRNAPPRPRTIIESFNILPPD